MSKKLSLLILFVAVVFFVAWYYTSGYVLKLRIQQFVKSQNNLANFSWSNLRNTNQIYEIKTIIWEIKQINGNTIVINDSFSWSNLSNKLWEREIIISNNIKIYNLKLKSRSVIKKEFEDFRKKITENGGINISNEQPKPYNKTETTISDLKIWAKIIIESDKSIKDIKKFEPIKIWIFPTNYEKDLQKIMKEIFSINRK